MIVEKFLDGRAIVWHNETGEEVNIPPATVGLAYRHRIKQSFRISLGKFFPGVKLGGVLLCR